MCGIGSTFTPVRAQVGDGDVEVVDTDREVVARRRALVALHQVHLLAACVEPVAAEPEVGPRQHREAEHVACRTATRFVLVVDADGDVMDP